jgi:hypothetical protein
MENLYTTLSGMEDDIKWHHTNIINVYQSFLKINCNQTCIKQYFLGKLKSDCLLEVHLIKQETISAYIHVHVWWNEEL